MICETQVAENGRRTSSGYVSARSLRYLVLVYKYSVTIAILLQLTLIIQRLLCPKIRVDVAHE